MVLNRFHKNEEKEEKSTKNVGTWFTIYQKQTWPNIIETIYRYNLSRHD